MHTILIRHPASVLVDACRYRQERTFESTAFCRVHAHSMPDDLTVKGVPGGAGEGGWVCVCGWGGGPGQTSG